MAVQDLEDELVQDVLIAASALRDLWSGREGWREEQRHPLWAPKALPRHVLGVLG